MYKISCFLSWPLFTSILIPEINAKNITHDNQINLTPIDAADLIINGLSSQQKSNAQGTINDELPENAETFGFFALGYESVTFNADALATLKTVYLKPLAYNLRELKKNGNIHLF